MSRRPNTRRNPTDAPEKGEKKRSYRFLADSSEDEGAGAGAGAGLGLGGAGVGAGLGLGAVSIGAGIDAGTDQNPPLSWGLRRSNALPYPSIRGPIRRQLDFSDHTDVLAGAAGGDALSQGAAGGDAPSQGAAGGAPSSQGAAGGDAPSQDPAGDPSNYKRGRYPSFPEIIVIEDEEPPQYGEQYQTQMIEFPCFAPVQESPKDKFNRLLQAPAVLCIIVTRIVSFLTTEGNTRNYSFSARDPTHIGSLELHSTVSNGKVLGLDYTLTINAKYLVESVSMTLKWVTMRNLLQKTVAFDFMGKYRGVIDESFKITINRSDCLEIQSVWDYLIAALVQCDIEATQSLLDLVASTGKAVLDYNNIIQPILNCDPLDAAGASSTVPAGAASTVPAGPSRGFARNV